jgi:hypothetical protein
VKICNTAVVLVHLRFSLLSLVKARIGWPHILVRPLLFSLEGGSSDSKSEGLTNGSREIAAAALWEADSPLQLPCHRTLSSVWAVAGSFESDILDVTRAVRYGLYHFLNLLVNPLLELRWRGVQPRTVYPIDETEGRFSSGVNRHFYQSFRTLYLPLRRAIAGHFKPRRLDDQEQISPPLF